MFEKAVDKQGRISISSCLFEMAEIKPGESIAICYKSEKQLVLRPIDDVKGYKVLAHRKLDSKGRLFFAKSLGFSKCLVYVMDNELIVEGVE